jgi:hypothetical protein
MLRKGLLLIGLCGAGVSFPVVAQEGGGSDPAAPPAEESGEAKGADSTMGWGVSLGWFLGDDVTKQTYPGFGTAAIDDDLIFGGCFYNETSERALVEIRLQFSPNQFINTPNGTISMVLWMIDVAYVPHWQLGKIRLGVPFGLGWAGSHASKVLADSIPLRDPELQLKDGSGMQYFIGGQATMPLGKSAWSLQFDARLHRLHRLVNVREVNVQALTVTLGLSRSF